MFRLRPRFRWDIRTKRPRECPRRVLLEGAVDEGEAAGITITVSTLSRRQRCTFEYKESNAIAMRITIMILTAILGTREESGWRGDGGFIAAQYRCRS